MVINYKFRDITLLERALTHKSYTEDRLATNERLEFLGDAVLDLIMADFLLDKYPTLSEGKLTRMRSKLVCKSTLGELGLSLNLPEHIKLSTNEAKTGGAKRVSILADCVEALIAAIYLDSNDFSLTKSVVFKWFKPLLKRLDVMRDSNDYKDAKTLLQELVQSKYNGLTPSYILEHIGGSQNSHEYVVRCCITSSQYNSGFLGTATTKKQAEQQAALLALQELQEHG